MTHFKEKSGYLCIDCGFVANHLTMLRRYGRKSLKPAYDVMTMASRVCDICLDDKTCAPYRDYFHPTHRAMKTIFNYLHKGEE